MPIDFAAIAARFAVAFAAQLRNATAAQRGLARALDRRRQAARSVELATKQFPIVRFYDGAVTMKLGPSQRALLTPATPPLSVGEGFAAGGRSFLDGLGRAVDPLRDNSQETAIARFLTGAHQALAAVEASLRRFEVPKPEMFDPNKATASDLFGLAALGFRALAEASRRGGEVDRLVEQIRGTMGVLGMTASKQGTGTTEPASVRSLAETMDAFAFEALAGMVVIGTLPTLVATMLTDLVRSLQQSVLAELVGIERKVLDFRADAFEAVFVGLTRLADRGVRLVGGAYEVISANVLFQLKFFRGFGTELAVGIREFVAQLTEFLGEVVGVLRWIPDLLRAITRFELTELVSSKLGWLVHHTIDLSLDNLLDADGLRVNTELQDDLNGILDTAEEYLEKAKDSVLDWVVGDKIEYGYRQLARARWLVRELFASGGPTTAIPQMREAAPLVFHSDFPDLGETVFGAGAQAGVVAVLDRIENAARTGIGTALNRAGSGMTDLAGEFAATAARSSRVDSRRLTRVTAQADLLAESVFGPEVASERQAISDRPEDMVARAFESWLATGGFLVVGEVIPGYVKEMADHWRATLAEGTELTAELTPTSPHILRQRAVLGRVALPRLTLHAGPGQELDERFADLVADQFAGAVREAYETGQRKLAGLAESKGRP
jgi:hypothetical protein